MVDCTTDLAVRCEHVVADAGGLTRVDLAEQHRVRQRNITSARDCISPVELTAARVRRPQTAGSGFRVPLRHRSGTVTGAGADEHGAGPG
ncbi:hypothetical protein GCM10027174_09000 [Salinifilum aidingensis]